MVMFNSYFDITRGYCLWVLTVLMKAALFDPELELGVPLGPVWISAVNMFPTVGRTASRCLQENRQKYPKVMIIIWTSAGLCRFSDFFWSNSPIVGKRKQIAHLLYLAGFEVQTDAGYHLLMARTLCTSLIDRIHELDFSDCSSIIIIMIWNLPECSRCFKSQIDTN